MSASNYRRWIRLRRSYRFGLLFFPVIVSSAALVLVAPSITEWISRRVGIADGMPVRDQPNGLAWLFAFLAAMAGLTLVAMFIGVLTQAFFCWAILRWPWAKVASVYLRSEYPKEWKS